MAAAAILDFQILYILTVGTLKMAKLHYRAKFRLSRSNRGRDMAIFRFFQDGGHPPSWISYVCVRTTHEGHLVVFIVVRNLAGIDTVVFDNMHVFRFHEFGLKTPIQAPKIGVFGGFYPLSGEQCQRNPQKTHPCASPRRLSHHARKSVDASDL